MVGAYPLSAQSYPRATGDKDLWIRNHPENAARVWQALKVFGATLSRIRQEEFPGSDLIFEIGVAPNRIDIITNIDGVTFDEAWREREEIQIYGKKIPVISKTCLIKSKKETGRLKDLADVQLLEGKCKNGE